ncbi:dTDP-fucosamine acetyltransferase [compost metagenome]
MLSILEWDSNFFGINIATVTDINDLSFNFREYIQVRNIDFVQVLCRIDEISKINKLEYNGFHFADVKITYRINLEDVYVNPIDFKLATNKDKLPIRKIAEGSFFDSRYYGYEHLFKVEKVNRMYSLWAEKSIDGQFDDFCLKITHSNATCGFITVKIINTSSAVIGIFAIDEQFRGRGIGCELMNSLFSFLRTMNVCNVEVSTQGKNILAQNFYIKQGFKVSRLESWYYYSRDISKHEQ